AARRGWPSVLMESHSLYVRDGQPESSAQASFLAVMAGGPTRYADGGATGRLAPQRGGAQPHRLQSGGTCPQGRAAVKLNRYSFGPEGSGALGERPGGGGGFAPLPRAWHLCEPERPGALGERPGGGGGFAPLPRAWHLCEPERPGGGGGFAPLPRARTQGAL